MSESRQASAALIQDRHSHPTQHPRRISIPQPPLVRAEDAVEFLLAVATAIQAGAASYAGPRTVESIATGLRRWCSENNVARVADLTGGLLS